MGTESRADPTLEKAQKSLRLHRAVVAHRTIARAGVDIRPDAVRVRGVGGQWGPSHRTFQVGGSLKDKFCGRQAVEGEGEIVIGLIIGTA